MRMILGLLLILGARPAAPAEGPREVRTDLLTYAEMMQLNPEKRVEYVRDLGRLLALMEKQFEGKYDNASVAEVRERHGQVAMLLRLLGAPTEAEAATDWKALDPMNPGRAAELVRQQKKAGDATATPPREETEVVKPKQEASAGEVIIPGTPANEPKPDGDWQHPPAKLPTPKYEVPTFPKTMPKDLQGTCQSTPPECKPMTDAERKAIIIKFRASDEDLTCMAGGHFTDKRRGAKAGSCEIIRKMKFGDKVADCEKPNEGVCNPFPFCLKYPAIKVTKKDKSVAETDIPISFCARSGQDFTQRCMAKYDKILKEKKYDRTLNEMKKYPAVHAQMKEVIACDGEFKGIATPIADAYATLRAKTIKLYRGHCLSTKGYFGQLFCKECGLVYQQIRTMMKNTGHECDVPSDTPPYEAPDKKFQMPPGTDSSYQ